MSAAATIKAEPLDEDQLPAPTVTLTGQDRTDRELQECNADKCSEDLRKLREEALAEGVTIPDGWSCSRRLRLTGASKGKAYTQYHDPQGTILRSKEAVRKRLGLPRKLKCKAAQSGKTSSVSADDKSSQQMLKKTRQGKVAKASSSSCLLADLTDADLPPHLLQVPITCGERKLGITKPGLWYPCLKVVQCQGQCCADKPAAERTMRCSGQDSFEAHCGKNPKGNHWRQSFKVNQEGYEGVPVETFMDLHGIKLRKPKKSSPLQQPSAPSTSTPGLHGPNSPAPASAQPALHGIQRQQSSPQADQEGGREEDLPTQQQQQQQQPQQPLQQQVMAAPAVEVSTEGLNPSQHMQAVEASIHATVMEDAVDADVEVMDEPNAEMQNTPMQQDVASDDDMVQSEAEDDTPGPGVQQNEGVVGTTQDAQSAAIASLKAKQVKLNRDHKNKVRCLRRQLKHKEDELEALQHQLEQQRANAQSVHIQQTPSSQETAVVANDRVVPAAAAGLGPSNQGGEQCCKERQACIENLEKELASAKAECQQQREVQQRAATEYGRLLEENCALRQDGYKLRVSGCGKI